MYTDYFYFYTHFSYSVRDRLAEKQICFRFFGDLSLLPPHLQKLIAQVEELTKDFRKLVWVYAIITDSYTLSKFN